MPRKPRYLEGYPLGPQAEGYRCPGITVGSSFPRARVPDPSLRPATSISAGSLLPFAMGARLGRKIERVLERTEGDDPSHRRIRKRRKETRKKVRKATRR